MRKNLTHPNVSPLLGVTIALLQFISNWISGGELRGYIQRNPNADRLRLVGVPPVVLIPHSLRYQLSDVSKGLRYIHSYTMVHGDLTIVRGRSKSHFTTVLTPG